MPQLASKNNFDDIIVQREPAVITRGSSISSMSISVPAIDYQYVGHGSIDSGVRD